MLSLLYATSLCNPYVLLQSFHFTLPYYFHQWPSKKQRSAQSLTRRNPQIRTMQSSSSPMLSVQLRISSLFPCVSRPISRSSNGVELDNTVALRVAEKKDKKYICLLVYAVLKRKTKNTYGSIIIRVTVITGNLLASIFCYWGYPQNYLCVTRV